ncbi:death-associated inhibitor of apoptosis 1 isoform X2 [Drosophila rhopaloa]|uniref:RING-type domain-containing protein n=1 Tax=Drosophila rhopaloa TaxID=1041015 RepID=A0ABM5GX60_DRORH|nr:death-associated inhibitor of apoptosis 1 isoform X2 [Drosophila rhopaloa]XP_016970958.2 death-associated inhibitor of apoptosis 1 isoform X2 [Drosophila rhopaloa]XP_016971021.2 death-associated inhibitor of apoptosis 1 isoform X2 [Drosophila rhopaloa]XP_016971091.2 death-associated inhibitor of apoptosis 1 isoform X2 [Drosophila rhopaloa]XP_016971173.2 death-associated inhibitor of apoptosis 1 isoform X2 [Drosophila rhopaloa]
MANVVTNPRYIHVHSALEPPTVTDQVDNNTNATQLFKNNIFSIMNGLNHEEARLKTFLAWPLEWLDKRQLAQTGMYYTNVDDKVKCYFCGVEIGRWERQDLPVPEHQKWSPNCPLLRRRTTNNVPLNIEALDRILPEISYDICGSNDSTTAVELREDSYAEGSIPMSQINQSHTANATATVVGSASHPPMSSIATQATTATQASGDVQPELCRTPAASGNYFPEYPEYAVESTRLRTFEAWPRNLKQKPQQLAEAGFFYTGVGDRVRCFSCGGGLKDWDDNDEPWEQHALWLSQCRFVKLMKGQVYIDTVAAKPEPAEEKEESSLRAEVASSQVTSDEASEAASSGDVLPATAATRILEKIQEASAAVPPSASNSGPSSIPEEKLCKICYGAEYNTAFLPCGHVVACAKCASSVTKCPLCRKPFTDVMRVYFS